MTKILDVIQRNKCTVTIIEFLIHFDQFKNVKEVRSYLKIVKDLKKEHIIILQDMQGVLEN